jgi:predicted nucleotidyltransferase
MISDQDHAILQQFAERVRQVYPSARIWAFGSRTRGEATGESNLDVCVVLDQLDPDIRARIGDMAWEVGFDHEMVISTVVFSIEMFEHGRCSVSSLVKTIRDEGVAA